MPDCDVGSNPLLYSQIIKTEKAPEKIEQKPETSNYVKIESPKGDHFNLSIEKSDSLGTSNKITFFPECTKKEEPNENGSKLLSDLNKLRSLGPVTIESVEIPTGLITETLNIPNPVKSPFKDDKQVSVEVKVEF